MRSFWVAEITEEKIPVYLGFRKYGSDYKLTTTDKTEDALQFARKQDALAIESMFRQLDGVLPQYVTINITEHTEEE